MLKAAVAKVVKNAEQRSAGSWNFSEKTDRMKNFLFPRSRNCDIMRELKNGVDEYVIQRFKASTE